MFLNRGEKMKSFSKVLSKSLIEDLGENEDLETYPYVEKLADFVGIEAADLYNFFNSSVDYDSMEDVEKFKDKMEDWEYEIYKIIFNKFHKFEDDFNEEDVKLFGSSIEEKEQFHSALI